MGLPGSGKSTYANKLESNDKNKVRVIDFDDMLNKYKSKASQRLSRLNDFGGYSTYTFIIDGLIHTNEQLVNVINEVIKNKELKQIEVHYWKENRTQCLINDEGRRSLSSTTSIKHLPFDVPDISRLQSLFENIIIIPHKVAIKPDWLIFAHKHGLSCSLKDPYFKSDSWSTGGSHGNCWNDRIISYEGDEPLTEFEEFDELMISIKPDITLLAYKELYKSSVSIGTEHTSDYYGGRGSNYAFYQCDVKALYEKLKELSIMSSIEVREGSSNIFKDLGYIDPEVTLLKAELVYKINTYIEEHQLTAEEVSLLLGIELKEVNNLKKGLLSTLSLHDLRLYITYLSDK